MPISHWYITVAAVRQYMAICGIADSANTFDRAAVELENLAREARLARDVGPGQESQLWRVNATVRGRRTRLELIISLAPREEGDLPQLIAVRNKGA
jgi:UDP-glucose 4-epimerase